MPNGGRAFALAYTLLVAAVIMLFAGALFTRSTETLRLTGLDVNSVHAAALADSGAQMAYTLLRDHDPQYYKSKNPLKSVDLGPEFAPSVIGGTFEVTVDDTDYSGTGLYPDNGTFYTVVSTGRVGNHVARSEMTLKMTNPLLNYLFMAPRDFYLGGGQTVVGPLIVNADPASGEPGDLTFSHANESYSDLSHRYYMGQDNLKLDIQARATGNIQIHNWTDHGNTLPPLQLNGRYPAQSLQHQDFTILTTGGAFVDKVIFTDDVALEAHAKFTTKIPQMEKLLEKLRAGAGPAPLDISGQTGGVLVEFAGKTVYVSEVKTRQIGRVFDKAQALEEGPDLVDTYNLYFGQTTAASQAMLDAEVAWDDPEFPDMAYPADIGPGTGDYVDIYRLERGATLATYTLSDTSWTNLYLTTSRTDLPTADGRTQAPPVFLRGMIDGKVMVAYDVTDDTLDPNADKLHMIILGEHEDPSDSPANKIPVGGAPGVNGGILYQDRNIKADPDQTTFTNDRCLLLCRGTINGGGNSGGHCARMHDLAGNPVDYRAQLNNLDKQYSQFYTGAPGDRNFRCSAGWGNFWGDGAVCNFYGIAVAAHSQDDRWRVANTGEMVDKSSSKYGPGLSHWKDTAGGVTAPPGGESVDTYAIFPFAFRCTLTPATYYGDVRGSFHSVQTSYELNGDAYYDYSWQALKEQEIRTELFLPIQPVIANFQRL